MGDRHWIVWIVAMIVAAVIAKHVGSWVVVIVVVVLVGWSISVENKPHSSDQF